MAAIKLVGSKLVSKLVKVKVMERGLIDADLGGHVVKKRVAIGGRGKSGGHVPS